MEDKSRQDVPAKPDRNPTVVFEGPGEVSVIDRAVPTLASGELLVRTRRTLISTGTELTILSGDFPVGSAWAALARFPFVAGYSNVGDVVAVADDVGTEWVGARVASMAPHSLHASVKAQDAYRAPSDDAVLDPLTMTSLGHIVMNGVRRANVRLGESVVVYGLGLIGQLAVRLCHICGARPVIGIDVAPQRCARLPTSPGVIGVAVDGRHPDALRAVAGATGNRMADVVIEATGSPELIPLEFAALRESQGRFLVLSSPRGAGTTFNFHDLCNSPSHTIIGAHAYSQPKTEAPDNPWTMGRNAELLHTLMRDGELDLSPLISHRFAFAAAPDAYRMLVADRLDAMAVVLDWDR